jgi:4'-phosphopantetheinyl transferase
VVLYDAARVWATPVVTTAIEVAWIDLEPDASALRTLESLLDDADRARVAARATPELRRRLAVSLASRRIVAAEVLGVAPSDVELIVGADGRRGAAGPGTAPVALSVSTCGATGIVAIAPRGAVGVDIEDSEEIPSGEAFVSRVATSSERRALACLDDVGRRRALHILWTRKEAYLKAIGEGIGSRLTSLDVPLAEGLHGAPWRPATDGTWFLYDLDCPRPGLAGALTTTAGDADTSGELAAAALHVQHL